MEEKNLSALNNISKEKAWKMINKFRQHYKGKEYNGAKYLTHGVWFSFEDLESWTAAAKKEGCTGVRIYFATYLEKEDHPSRRDPSVVRDYKHRNTLVLISTKTIDGVERDQYKVAATDSSNDPMNKGELCPEECGEEN